MLANHDVLLEYMSKSSETESANPDPLIHIFYSPFEVEFHK